jgi:thiamine phosphate synthase YjbQ (UPF0047 family)
MYICRWSFNAPFGKRGKALNVAKQWDKQVSKALKISKTKSRIYVGHIGASESLIVSETEFKTLKDFEEMQKKMAHPKHEVWARKIAPYIIPGSQKWEVFKTVE